MKTKAEHKNAADGKWYTFSIFEQLGNIGSEVHRASMWRGKDEKRYAAAVDRSLELFDLTLEDPRWRNPRKREVALVREVFCDAVCGGTLYKSSIEDIARYLDLFAYVARLRAGV